MLAADERALFLDRDGVINIDHGYVHRVDDVVFIDGIFELCKEARELGYRLIIVTNQAGIGRGYYTVEAFHRLMEWMRREFSRRGVEIDAVYYSPYHPEHGIGEYKRDHEDRKPNPGMLLRAAADFGLALHQSVMVGDSCTDVSAANRAGLRRMFLLGEPDRADCDGVYTRVSSLLEVARGLKVQP